MSKTAKLVWLSALAAGLVAAACFQGCTIPVVGNSPQEVKHRQSIQEDDAP